jgi:hypothetical protein
MEDEETKEYKVEVRVTYKGSVLVDAVDEDDAKEAAELADNSDISIEDSYDDIEAISAEENA